MSIVSDSSVEGLIGSAMDPVVGWAQERRFKNKNTAAANAVKLVDFMLLSMTAPVGFHILQSKICLEQGPGTAQTNTSPTERVLALRWLLLLGITLLQEERQV
jgi:hypothetical protein